LHITIEKFTFEGTAIQGVMGSYSMSIAIQGITMDATIDCTSVRIWVADESVENAQVLVASVQGNMQADCQAGSAGTLVKQL
tara:strand:- start:1688 stop:1933 length:246 start_codon:yes stop_codon:yes gene_type:complete